MNNYYLTSQLVAERQAAVAAGLTHQAKLKDARAARKASASAASASQPSRTRTRTRRFIFRPSTYANA
jgi:hypothetical protein